MRIGELLVEQGRLRESALRRELADQRGSGKRLVSLLIASGQLEFDDGARALAEQRDVPCALARHLANRDPELADRLPPELGRAACALPIGVTSSGALIVCARDPDAALHATLTRAIGAEIVLAVAPASRLEHLVNAAYGANETEEFDVNLDTGLLPTPPPLPDMDALDPDSVRLALTDLDDVRVSKDPGVSGQFHAPTRNKVPTLPPLRPPSLESTRFGLERALTRDDATELALAFMSGRWSAGVLLVIQNGSAVAYRGRGATHDARNPIVVSLVTPSTVQHAIEHARTTSEQISGPSQTTLARALNAGTITAAPVIVDHEVVAALAVGDVVYQPDDEIELDDGKAATAELATLASALGDAYDRIRRG